MSTLPTTQLDTYYNNDISLVPKPPSSSRRRLLLLRLLQQQHRRHIAPFSIVYGSSDKSMEEYQTFIKKHPNWISVPYGDENKIKNYNDDDDDDERIAMQRYFKICSNRELDNFRFNKRFKQIF